jgi:hypothetical protein
MKKGLILSLLLFLPVTIYIIFSLGVPKVMPVSVYGPRSTVLVKKKNGREKTDTLYYQIKPFSGLDAASRPFSTTSLKGNLYIAAFMEQDSIGKLLGELYADLKLNAHKWTRSRFVFFLRDDSTHAAITKSTLQVDFPWESTQTIFLSDSLFNRMRNEAYFVSTPGMLQNPWTDKSNFILIDRVGRIRGYYDIRTVTELRRLKEDIKHVTFHDEASATLEQQNVEQRRKK